MGASTVDAVSNDRLTFILAEPPSINHMLDLAKKRTRRTRDGKWMRRSLPVVYDQALEAYELACLSSSRLQGISPPKAPWKQWRVVSAHFRLHGLRDLIELNAGLKWPVDFLVRKGFVQNDSPKELIDVAHPTQEIARANRGVTLVIERIG